MSAPNIDSFAGCLLGLALGDALGAPYEGGPVERLVWRVIGKTRQGAMRWTDDTQMAIDVAESLVAHGSVDEDDLARRFGQSYRWSRGYGPAAARLLKRIRRGENWRQANRAIYPEGSFGNGGAMRAPVVGVFFAERLDAMVDAARRSAVVTHAHPLALEGAVLVAFVTALAATGCHPTEIVQYAFARCQLGPFRSRLELATRWLQSEANALPKEIRRQLGVGIAASESCVTAVYVSLRFLARPFEELIDFIVGCGGDVDTIGAMAGGIWGAANGMGRLPAAQLDKLEQLARLKSLAVALHAAAIGNA